MQTKFIKHIFALTLCMVSLQTYGAPTASLWGTLDEPVPPIKQIEQQQQEAEAQQQAIANQKTVCEILSAQPTLSGDTANAARIKEGLLQAHKAAAPEFKMFVVSQDGANDLYMRYRDLYLKTYCVAGKK